MRRFGRILGRMLLVLALVAGGMWAFGPYEPVDLKASFEPRRFGEGVQVYFESVESNVADLKPGTEKRVIWQEGFKEQRTPYSVLYVHGFSASSEEIRPVPDKVANALGANLVFARLRGHGRSGEAMAEATVNDWMMDLAEGLAAARQVGEQVVVIASSTGATLATAAAMDPDLSEDISAMIFVSPNYGLKTAMVPLLTCPAARYWLPPLAGRQLSFPARSEDHARFWTRSYPSVAVLPMAALVDRVMDMDVGEVDVSALFLISEEDRIVRSDLTAQVAQRWGGVADLHWITPGPDDDANAHTIAGDILSPGQTDAAVRVFLGWLKEKGIE